MKRFFISTVRIYKTGLQNLFRNLWLTSAATLVMVVTISSVLMTYASTLTLDRTIKTVTDKIDISLYLKDSLTAEKRTDLKDKLLAIDNVASVDYISKDDAKLQFLERYKDRPDFANSLLLTGENPLPASFRVKPKDANKLDAIAKFIDSEDAKTYQSEKPSYSGERKSAIDKIIKAAHFVEYAGIALSLVFAGISMLLIFNTIRMAIFNRRDEIDIMKLIGASRRFIRGPFLVEAGAYGALAGMIATMGFSLLLSLQGLKIKYYLEDIDIEYTKQYFSDYRWEILGLAMLAGILIAVVSSALATQRYLSMGGRTLRLKNKRT
jgi:cell division transport system permease protein